ncbi:MAG: alpha/beta hydrolase-fold protein [Muribaculaceae bacterium]|jgi:predicted alpha/beta superfamily hydrolase|nr:alpha/beta hydrolase-fold protein [Muribaculaceae bacterium]
MPNVVQKIIDNKKVSIVGAEGDSDIVVYCNSVNDDWGKIIGCCKQLGSKPFHFVLISDIDWDKDLSPWPAGKIISGNDNFEGKAQEYLQWIEDKVVPIAPQGHKIMAGYSMAGLFALYVPYVSDKFEAIASASGSVWFPQFFDFITSHQPAKVPRAVYLSIGDLESKSKNAYLQQTVEITRNIYEHYEASKIPTIFELHKGNHFKDYEMRLAKAITWTVEQESKII